MYHMSGKHLILTPVHYAIISIFLLISYVFVECSTLMKMIFVVYATDKV